MRFETDLFEGMQYLTAYPDGFCENKKYPVIVYLHGAGTRGTDINVLRDGAYFKIVYGRENFPFVTVAPLCHENSWFDLMHLLKMLVRKIAQSEFADSSRIYLMGNSMGGYATWQLAMSIPEDIAAIVPICGGGMYWNTERLKNVPVWAFHGQKDGTVFVEESEKMVNAVNKRGGNAKLTIYPEAMHDSWTDTYKNPEVFEWMLSHKKCEKGELCDSFKGSKIYG